MKEITWVLMKGIEDPETNIFVNLGGVQITGTPLQVATVFEGLRQLPGKVDLSVVNQNDNEIYEMGENTLKEVRATQKDVDWYDDPDKTDEDDIARARGTSLWKVRIT